MYITHTFSKKKKNAFEHKGINIEKKPKGGIFVVDF